MRTSKTAANKTVRKTVKLDSQAELAAKTASIITQAISRANQSKSGKSPEGKITIHVHVGDVIMMGFDEAVDAEEWGMRENNTEIIGGKTAGKRNVQGLDADALAEKNRKITRNIILKKGQLELNATENSEPARKRAAAKKTIAKKMPASKRTKRK